MGEGQSGGTDPPPAPGRQNRPGSRLGQLRALFQQRTRPDWMTRDVRLVILARVFMSGTRALASVLTPLYLAKIGMSAFTLGELFVVVALAAALMATVVGLLADRIGRKPFLVALPIAAAFSGLVFALTRSVPLLFLFAALGSFGRGSGAGGGSIGPYQPAEQAMLTDAVSPQSRNMMFGVVAFASSLGALIGGGPLAAIPDLVERIGGAGFQGADAYRPAFFAIFLLSLTAGLLAVPIANPKPARPATPRRQGGRWWRPRIGVSTQSWRLLRQLFVINGVNGLAVGFFGPFVTYWFFRRYGVGPGTIGILYTIINLATMISNLGASRVATKFGLVRAVLVVQILQGLLLFPMVLMPTFWLAGAFYLVRMMMQRLGMPLRQSYVMGMVPATERGSVGALSQLPFQGTSAASPALAGYLFSQGSLALPFEVGGILQAAAAVLFFLYFHKAPPPEELASEALTEQPVSAAAGARRAAPEHQPAHDD